MSVFPRINQVCQLREGNELVLKICPNASLILIRREFTEVNAVPMQLGAAPLFLVDFARIERERSEDLPLIVYQLFSTLAGFAGLRVETPTYTRGEVKALVTK